MSPTGNLKEQLEQYVKKVKEDYESCRDREATTKGSLIMPLFKILGYDETNPRECQPEYKADFGKVRGKQPVDWAFFVNGSLAFLVEAKAVGKKIDRYDEQLGDYYAKGQGLVKLGVLTTGVQWRFFTDLDKANVMDREPFLEWDVLKGPIPYDLLTILQREKFDPDNIKAAAKKQHRQSLLVLELSAILKPSPEFVKLALQNLEDRHLTEKVVDEWRPILVSAIREWAQQQRLTAALDRATDTPGEDQQPSGKQGEKLPGDEQYLEFWKPIRTEPDGLFAGKPCDGSWIIKSVRRINIVLVVHNHACRVELGFSGEGRKERREKAVKLFPAADPPLELHESEKFTSVRFPVLDKGVKDRDNWPEIREKLTKLGADIYNTLSNSDV